MIAPWIGAVTAGVAAYAFNPVVGPGGWAVLVAAAAGIVALYFLKLRRQPVEVPSTLLWRETLEDLHVNSLFQRLRRSILLALQMLMLAAAAIALLRPSLGQTASQTNRRIFLLDTSASMSARDATLRVNAPTGNASSGERLTRFEAARRRISGAIDAMTDTEQAMLITFDDRAETLQSFTSDRVRLRAALGRANIKNHGTTILPALRAADGLANPRRSSQIGDVNDVQVADAVPADLIVYSDGGFDAVQEFSLGNLIPRFEPVGGDLTRNVAVTAMAASRNVQSPETIEVLATISNLVGPPATVTATLRGRDVASIDDAAGTEEAFLDAARLTLGAGESESIAFTLARRDAVGFSLTLQDSAGPDDFVLDDAAFAAIAPSRQVGVLVVTDGNPALETALQTDSVAGICRVEILSTDSLNQPAFATRAADGVDDLMIFDRCRPETMPRCNTLFVGDLPPTDWRYTSPPQTPTVIDIDRTDPLLQYTELYSLLIVEARGLEGPVGTKTLVTADIGPVLSLAPRGVYRDLVMGFPLIGGFEDSPPNAVNTNWYVDRSWPVFLLNVLRQLAGAADVSQAESFRPGKSITLRIPAEVDEVQIRHLPSSGPTTMVNRSVEPGGTVTMSDRNQTGIYVVSDRNSAAMGPLRLFTVNLFNRTESLLTTPEQIEIGYRQIDAAASGALQPRQYWRPALWLALGAIAAEWWWFGRRVAV